MNIYSLMTTGQTVSAEKVCAVQSKAPNNVLHYLKELEKLFGKYYVDEKKQSTLRGVHWHVLFLPVFHSSTYCEVSTAVTVLYVENNEPLSEVCTLLYL